MISRFFAQAVGFTFEESRRVCFLQEEKTNNLDQTINNTGCPKDPAPSRGQRYKSASYGSKPSKQSERSGRTLRWSLRWPQKRRKTINTNSFPSLFRRPAITSHCQKYSRPPIFGQHESLTSKLHLPQPAVHSLRSRSRSERRSFVACFERSHTLNSKQDRKDC